MRITEDLIRKRAEHNEGMVSTLEEVALHQQNIECVEALGQLCPHLKILYLQNNLIGKIENLHKLKELDYLNLAVNNITKVQNLQRCESLRKLDLTVNFVAKAGLLSLASLTGNHALRELHLVGNPCTDWHGYRQYVLGVLPQLTNLDGQEVKQSERIAARQAAARLAAALNAELRAEGIDPDTAGAVEDDSIAALYAEGATVPETGYVDESGELKRPWCPATRILDHREMEAANQAAEAKKKAAQEHPLAEPKQTRLQSLPPMVDDGRPFMQRNEGKWDFTLDESEDRRSIVLDVAIGRFMDTSLIEADVQPTFVRLLIKGRLLQLLLPIEVRPDASTAQRSTTTGHLLLTMPKEDETARVTDATCIRPRQADSCHQAHCGANIITTSSTARKVGPAQQQQQQMKGRQRQQLTSIHNIVNAPGDDSNSSFLLKEVRKAAVMFAGDDDDDVPPL